MKKTPVILMSTAFLSVPCAEGAAQKSAIANPIIKTAVARMTQSQPTEREFKDLVSAYTSLPASMISFSMRFVGDLGYDSCSFEMLIQDIENAFFNDVLRSPISSGSSFESFTVRDLWRYVNEEWDQQNGDYLDEEF